MIILIISLILTAIESTLAQSRLNGNEYESAAIVKEVSEWNINLAEFKYNNQNWYIGQFIDDRFENLNPIK